MAQHHQFHALAPTAAQSFIKACTIVGDDSVYELGPGSGALTEVMLQHGATVYATEIDQYWYDSLQQRLAHHITSGALQLSCSDGLTETPPNAGTNTWRIVSNPPFQHSAALLHHWLTQLSDLPHHIDLILQQETAAKWLGGRGGHSRTSVLLELCGIGDIGFSLKRNDYSPPARVNTCHFTWAKHPKAPTLKQRQQVDRLLQLGFAGAHDVRSALRSCTTPAILKRQSRMHQWDPQAHPRFLSANAWLSLADFLASIGKLPE